MATVFLSYSRKDHFFAELVQRELADKEISVWKDSGQLLAGENWQTAIDRGISDSFAILVVLSPSSTESAYVTYEWASAMGRGKAVIPVMLEMCELHPKLTPIQYLNFTNWDSLPWQALIDRVKDIEANFEAQSFADEAADAAAPEPEPEAPSREAEAKDEILNYLNQRGFQMVSFQRIRKRIDPSYDDDLLNNVIRTHRNIFRPARLKGGLDGMAKL